MNIKKQEVKVDYGKAERKLELSDFDSAKKMEAAFRAMLWDAEEQDEGLAEHLRYVAKLPAGLASEEPGIRVEAVEADGGYDVSVGLEAVFLTRSYGSVDEGEFWKEWDEVEVEDDIPATLEDVPYTATYEVKDRGVEEHSDSISAHISYVWHIRPKAEEKALPSVVEKWEARKQAALESSHPGPKGEAEQSLEAALGRSNITLGELEEQAEDDPDDEDVQFELFMEERVNLMLKAMLEAAKSAAYSKAKLPSTDDYGSLVGELLGQSGGKKFELPEDADTDRGEIVVSDI